MNAERLIHADREPGAWMSHGRTYDEQRFSPLTEVNHETVARLGLAWYADFDTSRKQESTPLVVDGTLYVTTAWSQVRAYDAATGEPRWLFRAHVDPAAATDACCDVVNRGAAAWDGKIFVGALDGRLIALDAATGEPVWQRQTVDRSHPYTITGAPRVVKGKVLIGNGGADLGVRGYVSAYDADTGELAWRFWTVPGDPAQGFERPELEMAARTWSGEWWRLGGGGTVWDSMAYDPGLDLLYVGVGNGSPWNQSLRSPDGGDNLFLSSIVALDPDDGSYRWHYQTTPGETWDYTATQHMILADLEIGGAQRRVLMQAPKNGFFYVLDAATGELVSAESFVPVTWSTRVDPKTGRPVEVPEARYDRTDRPVVVRPNQSGAHNWHPMAYSPATGLVYLAAAENASVYGPADDFEPRRHGWNTGAEYRHDPQALESAGFELPENRAWLLAWDPVAQQAAWRHLHDDPRSSAGVLATAGGLVFQGDARGRFAAWDARTGERLWSFYAQAGIIAAPVSFMADGRQHIAIVTGRADMPEGPNGPAARTSPGSRNNSRLLVFALDGVAALPTEAITGSTTAEQAGSETGVMSPDDSGARTPVRNR